MALIISFTPGYLLVIDLSFYRDFFPFSYKHDAKSNQFNHPPCEKPSIVVKPKRWAPVQNL